ncbi:hypothetical protein AHF37_05482 [Paragonimus kellicotti]|nr:hypothetical protein AHF37_05482 [Paragonimus kellicotti]
MDAELVLTQSVTLEAETLNESNAIQYVVGVFFFVVGVVGVWLHGLNVKRLMKLDLILPEGFVSLHFHLALANLGIVAMVPFGGVSAFFHRYALEPHQTNCALDMTRQDRLSIFYLCALMLVTYVIPIGAAIVSLCLLWFTLTTDLQPTESDSNMDMSWTNWLRHTFGISLKLPATPMKEKPQSTLNQRLKLCTKVNAGILLTSSLTWLPIGILAACVILYGDPGLNPMLYYVPQLLVKWGCALTPVAYVSTLRRLQRQKSSTNLFIQLDKNK